MDDRPLYGLDIETDTSTDGLDPSVAAIVAVAVATESTTRVFTGVEAALLAELDQYLASLPPGVLVTWNGAAFDMPFLDDRARAASVPIGLELLADPGLAVVAHPLPGHSGAYRARWGEHRHLDGFRVYRADVGRTLGLSCGLKPLARLVGLRPVEVDRSAIDQLSAEDLAEYVASDACLARELVRRRWPQCSPGVDTWP